MKRLPLRFLSLPPLLQIVQFIRLLLKLTISTLVLLLFLLLLILVLLRIKIVNAIISTVNVSHGTILKATLVGGNALIEVIDNSTLYIHRREFHHFQSG